MPRLRQAVLAARDLEPTVAALRERLDLGEPHRDPGVAYFGMTNAVFAIGETFLEVVSPVDPDQPAARTALGQLDRAGTEVCGYMAMIQVEDLAAGRALATTNAIREVFAVELDDMLEVHLHPADVRGAIVALSQPRPPTSWRWAGDGWRDRSVPGAVTGITVAVKDPGTVAHTWSSLAGGKIAGVSFTEADDGRAGGIVEIEVKRADERHLIRPGELPG